jgi:dihydrofolate reductase
LVTREFLRHNPEGSGGSSNESLRAPSCIVRKGPPIERLGTMGRIIYSAIGSLDGYIEDGGGNFDWATPDEEVFRFVYEQELPVGTYLYGRRMYETMVYWETVDPSGQPDYLTDWTTMWRAAEKVVYSTSLDSTSSVRTRLERQFDPAAILELKGSSERDITVGGPGLAAHAFKAGLVDECQLFLNPIVVGGGKRALPADVRLKLELQEVHRFENGVVFMRYRV